MPQTGLQVYPNPASDQALVVAPVGGALLMHDVQGRVVLRMLAEAYVPAELDLTALAPGMYVVRIGDFVERIQVLR